MDQYKQVVYVYFENSVDLRSMKKKMAGEQESEEERLQEENRKLHEDNKKLRKVIAKYGKEKNDEIFE